jgi:DNA-directed RNA polymerase beta' subunit
MSNSIPSGLWSVGEASNIVRVLRDFGPSMALPVGFVARSIGRRPEEIQDVLARLAEQDVVELNEADKSVRLIR